MSSKKRDFVETSDSAYNLSSVKYKLLICGCSYSSEKMANGVGLYQDWCIKLKCVSEQCSAVWYVCNKCKIRTKLQTTDQLRLHEWKKHRYEQVIPTNPTPASPITNIFDNNIDLSTD